MRPPRSQQDSSVGPPKVYRLRPILPAWFPGRIVAFIVNFFLKFAPLIPPFSEVFFSSPNVIALELLLMYRSPPRRAPPSGFFLRAFRDVTILVASVDRSGLKRACPRGSTSVPRPWRNVVSSSGQFFLPRSTFPFNILMTLIFSVLIRDSKVQPLPHQYGCTTSERAVLTIVVVPGGSDRVRLPFLDRASPPFCQSKPPISRPK